MSKVLPYGAGVDFLRAYTLGMAAAMVQQTLCPLSGLLLALDRKCYKHQHN